MITRPIAALVLLGFFFSIGFGYRTWRHYRLTGSTGFRGVSGRVGSAEWFGGILFAAGIALGIAAPIVELDDPQRPLEWIDLAAVALVAIGIAGTAWAQATMGASWRIGVREEERTELIEAGPFRWVRNPIFSSMLIYAAGMTLFLPNALSIAAFAALLAAIELQVRFAEEPYLRRVHGEKYLAYCRRAGRFIPGLGKTSAR